MKKVFVSGIGTEVGKTLVSAILVEAWKADYWKPVQAGDLSNSDSHKVRAWTTSVEGQQFFGPRYALNTPASPHHAAALDGVSIDLADFALPETSRNLVIEGAGGLLVPLNAEHTVLDLIERLGLSVVLVSRNYLGSINHTLLSVEVLQRRGIPIEGIIFNGVHTPSTEAYIETYTQVPILGRINQEPFIRPSTIQRYAKEFAL